MTIQRSDAIVLSLVALWGSFPSAGAQETADGVTAIARPTPPAADEEKIIKAFQEFQLKQMEFNAQRKGERPTERGQHPKHHGFVVARFTVLEGLPEVLKVGLFCAPRSYTAVIRFSNTGAREDSSPDTHGMAIKLLGVKGKKLLENEPDAETQDFIMIDHPLFFARDVESTFATDKASVEVLKDPALLMRLKGLTGEKEVREEITAALAKQRPVETRIIRLRRSLIPSPLAREYFSTTPYKFGETAVKYGASRADGMGGGRLIYKFGETAVKYGAKPERPYIPVRTTMEGKNYLRAAMVEQLEGLKLSATFGFYVQRQGPGMPIEDPTVEWMAPWERVATIEIDAQDFNFREREEWGNALSYTPWHALEEHEPRGGINRARKIMYPASSALRHGNPGVAPKEPTEAEIPLKK